jgi:hypothetical protein
MKILPGKSVEPLNQGRLVFLLGGTVNVYIQQPRSGRERGLMKVVKEGSCLNSLSSILQIFSQAAPHGSPPSDLRLPATFDDNSVSFFTAEPCELVAITVSGASSPFQQAMGPMVQALLQRVYMVSFEISISHFECYREVLEVESLLQKVVNVRHSVKADIRNDIYSLLSETGDLTVPSSQDTGPLTRAEFDVRISQRTRGTDLSAQSSPDLCQPALQTRRSNPAAAVPVLKTSTSDLSRQSSATSSTHSRVRPGSILSKTEKRQSRINIVEYDHPSASHGLKNYVATTIANRLGLKQSLRSARSSQTLINGPEDSDLRTFADDVQIVVFKNGQTMLHCGERHHGIGVILDGRVHATRSIPRDIDENSHDYHAVRAPSCP